MPRHLTIRDLPPLVVILLLGIASAIPYTLLGSTLSARLQDQHVSIRDIAIFAMILTPYSLKFCWAWVVDYLHLPYIGRLGRRRSWLLLAQAVLLVSLWVMGLALEHAALGVVAICALLAGIAGATQDIVIDAYRTEYLPESLYGDGSAAAVLGWRLGALLAGAGAMTLSVTTSWQTVYLLSSLCILVGMAAMFIAGEPKHPIHKHTYTHTGDFIQQAILRPFNVFIRAYPQCWLILVFMVLYHIPDQIVGVLSTSFLKSMGYNNATIGQIGKLYGFFAVIAGTWLGAWLLRMLGLWRAFVICVLVQFPTNLSYLWIYWVQADVLTLGVAIISDNIAAGMITSCGVAYIMTLINKDYTAMQYALLSALSGIGSRLLAAPMGFVVEAWGWPFLFYSSAVAAVPLMITLCMLRSHMQVLEQHRQSPAS